MWPHTAAVLVMCPRATVARRRNCEPATVRNTTRAQYTRKRLLMIIKVFSSDSFLLIFMLSCRCVGLTRACSGLRQAAAASPRLAAADCRRETGRHTRQVRKAGERKWERECARWTCLAVCELCVIGIGRPRSCIWAGSRRQPRRSQRRSPLSPDARALPSSCQQYTTHSNYRTRLVSPLSSFAPLRPTSPPHPSVPPRCCSAL